MVGRGSCRGSCTRRHLTFNNAFSPFGTNTAKPCHCGVHAPVPFAMLRGCLCHGYPKKVPACPITGHMLSYWLMMSCKSNAVSDAAGGDRTFYLA